MPKQGGGATWHAGVQTYIDLIVADCGNLEITHPQAAGLFLEFAKHRQGAANFGFAELNKDKRLFDLLSKTEEGRSFYGQLEALLPVVTVSNSILGDVDNIRNVRTFPLSDFETDPLGSLARIQKEACLITHTEKVGFLDGIETLNRIVSLRPGLFGLSVNFNELISDWLKSKRAKLTEPLP